MALLFLGVKTEVSWINEIAKIPVVGGVFLFICIFIPAVLISFLIQKLIPEPNNDIGFTISMLVLLPSWNLLLWFKNIKLYFFFLPSWAFFGIIAIIKGFLLFIGNSN